VCRGGALGDWRGHARDAMGRQRMNRRGPARVGRVARSGPCGWRAPTPLVYFLLVGESTPCSLWSERVGRAVGRPVGGGGTASSPQARAVCRRVAGHHGRPHVAAVPLLAAAHVGGWPGRRTLNPPPPGSGHPRRVARGARACRVRRMAVRRLPLVCHRGRDRWAGATEPGGSARPKRRQRVFGRPRDGHRTQRPC